MEETRLDIDPGVFPDIVAPLNDLGDIGQFDAVYCCHALEHLYQHDVAKALTEFHRVLRPGGACIIIVPNLEGITPDDTVVYESPAGPITGRDMYYGKVDMVADNPWMSHKTGFTPDTLAAQMRQAGFDIRLCQGDGDHNAECVGVKA
jgi:ubiquinone/menaquinone biosynthesis C-methylase UbiE